MRYDDFLDQDELARYARALNQRARKHGVTRQLAAAELQDLILSSGGQCAWCGASVVNQPFELDHVISLATGGKHAPENLVVACPSCNRHKATRSPAQFASMLIARRGSVTPLIQRILDYYGIAPLRQKSLFDDDSPPPPASDGYTWSP